MFSLFLKGILWLCIILGFLYGMVVGIGYCVYRKERKVSAEWAMAIIAHLGEIAEHIAPIMEGWDATNLTVMQAEFLRKIVESEKIPEKVHEYLTIIQTPWMCGASSRLKAEVELMVKELDDLVDAFNRDGVKIQSAM